MNEIKQLWDKQEGETNKAYNAFLTYRDLGFLRSLKKATSNFYNIENVRRTSAKLRQMQDWSRKNDWVARCADWDANQNRIYQLEQREAIQAMNKRQASYGVAMQGKGIARLLDMNPEELTPDQASRLTKTGVEIERPARGEAIAISEHKINANVKLINIKDTIKKYEEALDEIAKEENG
jgi:hypothetical protein